MQFDIGNYKVTVREGQSRSVIEVSFTHHPGLCNVYIYCPEELIHPVFRRMFERKVKDVTDQVSQRQTMASTSRYIPTRHRSVKWSVRKFKHDFQNVHGDIDEAKDAWDYNRAPAGAVKTGKFGDLKAFLEGRKAGELDLIGSNK